MTTAKHIKANADWWRDRWLRDHPGKTLADYEVAGSCSDTDEGHKEYGEWFDGVLQATESWPAVETVIAKKAKKQAHKKKPRR